MKKLIFNVPFNIKTAVFKKSKRYTYILIFGFLGFIKYKFKTCKNLIDSNFNYFKVQGNKMIYKTNLTLLKNFFKWSATYNTKLVEIKGVGYKFKINSNNLYIVIGFSHLIKFNILPNIFVKLIKNKKLSLTSLNLFILNRFLVKLKSVKKLDVYKGKGIIYKGKSTIKKVGKASTF